MKFTVNSKQLYNTLSSVSKVISSKNALTILNNFLFELSDDTLIVTASDLETTLTARIAVTDTFDEGKFCADARRMVELCKALPEVDIVMEVNDRLQIKIDYPGGKFDFTALPGNEYPLAEENVENPSDEPITFTVPAKQLSDGVENTLFAVGTDELRPQMTGIYFDIVPEKITFVATDTRKLVRYTNSTAAPGVECAFILPAKPANILKNVLVGEENVNVTVTSRSASFKTADISLECRLIVGRFPDYNKVIPQSNPYTLTVDRHSMLNAVRRVGVFVDPSHGLVKFRLTPEKIELKAQDNNFCTLGFETIPCSFSGTEMVIGFSANFIIDIFNTLSTDNVIAKLADPSRPGLFLPEEDAADTELLMLLMPMTVNEF